jgi:succinate dehydrogenase / fumarate reductase cytochrome b subunit
MAKPQFVAPPEQRQPLVFSPARRVNRAKGVGYWAYWLNRISGLVLALYLCFHLGFLSMLYQGPEAYQKFLNVVTQPWAVVMDIALAAAAIYHGFNGVRIGVVGHGFAVRRQAVLFYGIFVAGLAVLVLMAMRMLGGE